MTTSFFRKKIPTIIALIILFAGAGAGVVLVGRDTNFLPRAGPEYTPKQVQTTNITDKSFSVSWVTDSATSGFIRYGTTPSLGTTITDDRDQLTGQTGDFKTHHITIRSLSPNTTYYFKIGSGPSDTLFDSNGNPHQITTGSSLSAPPDSETAYGTVVTPAQTPAEGSIIYLKLAGSAPLSTLVKASGSWALPISSTRNTSLTDYLSYDPDTETISLEIIGSDGQLTRGTTTSSNDQPTPTITLGENFDFTADSTTSQPEEDPTSKFNVDSLDTSGNDQSGITLENPGTQGEQVNTLRPQFQGSAPPSTQLNITLESNPTYQDAVTTDSTGNFNWVPPNDIEPGNHTITISYVDELGQTQTFKRNFTVLAQGQSELPSLTASPSASPSPGTTPISSPSPSPTLLPTPSPSPTIIPSPTPDLARTTQPSTSSGVPVSGTSTPTIIFLASGLGLIASGLFLSKKFSF